MARISKYQIIDTASQRSTLWNAGLYVRLSREDGDKLESESISSQKSILKDYVLAHSDLNIKDFYVDDGWSGTDFDRPDFQRMMDDIRNRRINCVIVKDLSRFGRNYVEAGKYLEVVFPMLKIRFIAVNDNIDSIDNPTSMNNVIVPFKNIMNDEYCRDISTKVKTALDIRRKQGKFIGSFALYGYKKDESDHHKLVIDEEAAEIVRLIYKKFLSGDSIIGISRYLNENGILCPSAYKRRKGLNYHHTSAAYKSILWCDSSVRRILTNEMYIGNMVQKKNEMISYKVHISQGVPRNKWIVVEGTHEGIVSKDDFEKAKTILSRDTRVSPSIGKLSLFAGFLRCPDCGRAMQKRTVSQPYKEYQYYACGTYRKMHSGACTKHMIRSDVLENSVLNTLNEYIRIASDFSNLIERIDSCNDTDKATIRLRNQIKAKENEIADAKKILIDLYPDFKSGLISKEQYLALKDRYENNISKAQNVIEEVKKQIEEFEQGIINNEFVTTFIKYRFLDKLSRDVLLELVDVIYVHEGGKIELRLKSQDAFQNAMDYLEQSKILLPNFSVNLQQMID